MSDRPNNADAVKDVLRESQRRITQVLRHGALPFVIGGECTLTIAMTSAFAVLERDVGIVYVDGGQDLAIPTDHPEEPILDSMGVAHMLDLPGTDPAIASIGPRRPLVRDRDLVFFGYSEEDEDIHGQVRSARIPASIVSADPAGAAGQALSSLTNDNIVIHIDVDVLDFLEVPAADIAVYGRGLTLRELEQSLRVLVRDPRCAGALLVEYNPDHDPQGSAARALVNMLSSVFAPGVSDRG